MAVASTSVEAQTVQATAPRATENVMRETLACSGFGFRETGSVDSSTCRSWKLRAASRFSPSSFKLHLEQRPPSRTTRERVRSEGSSESAGNLSKGPAQATDLETADERNGGALATTAGELEKSGVLRFVLDQQIRLQSIATLYSPSRRFPFLVEQDQVRG